jgi:hypothetical protein
MLLTFVQASLQWMMTEAMISKRRSEDLLSRLRIGDGSENIKANSTA